MKALAKALHGFQADAPPVHLDATNPHFRSRYASLGGVVAAVRPALNKHGLVYTQIPTNLDGAPALRTSLIHAESGEALEETTPLILPKQDPQGYGSALTYTRRYALLSILGLVGDDDDDANHASAGGTAAGSRGAPGPAQRKPDTLTAAAAPSTSGFKAPAGAAAAKSEPEGTLNDAATVRVHFGKNLGKLITDLAPKQRAWYAEDGWADLMTSKGNTPSADDRRVREAARILSGHDPHETSGPFAYDSDVPF